jgi:two-component system sensor histidine kinase CpxA
MKIRLHSSLYLKIILWMVFNLLVIGVLLLGLASQRYRFDPDRLLIFTPNSQYEVVARLIADELREATPAQREEILARYAETWQVEFLLFTPRGEQLAGRPRVLPEEVRLRLPGPFFRGAPPRWEPGEPPEPRNMDRPPVLPGGPAGEGPPPGRRPRGFLIRTTNPTSYWAGSRIPLLEGPGAEPIRGVLLLAVSDSFTGNGLFFDLKPLLLLAGVVLLTSILLWLPFVRRLTGTIKQLTTATERIADEQFSIRVADRRQDELGRLGRAVNHLAERLDGFVNGQKRFLGDISHELNSPLARMGIALEILEDRSDPALRDYVRDAREEVVLMSQLVNELLVYARTGLKGVAINLVQLPLRPLVETVVAREAAGRPIRIEVEEGLQALAQPDLLSRAVANLIRNALRYGVPPSGEGGEIAITGHREGERVVISVIDQGPGIPEELVDRIFDPFFRIEADRARETGGTGLGLAIVRTCVEACGGTVSATNRQPGLAVTISLPTRHES